MATRTVPTLKHRAEFMIPLLSLGLFICSVFLRPLGPPLFGGELDRGWKAAFLAAWGTLATFRQLLMFHPSAIEWVLALASVLGTLANVGFVVGWFRWRPDRRFGAAAALVSLSAGVACLVPLKLEDRQSMNIWRHLGPGYWMWISAPAVLLLGSWLVRERPTRPGGFPVVVAAAPSLDAADERPSINRNVRPREVKARAVALSALVVLALVALLWWWLLPGTMLSAARGGHYATVKCLRAIGVNAAALTPAMLDAAHTGDLGAVRFYLEAGVNPNVEEIISPHAFSLGGSGVRTPLYEAIGHNDLAMMDLLLKHGADPNRFCGPPNSVHHPLEYALQKNNSAMVRLLWNQGARLPGPGQALVELRLSDDPTALAKSARGRQLLIQAVPMDKPSVKALLDAGADANIMDPARGEPLLFGADPDALNLLLSHGADPDARDRRRRTALHLAAVHRQLTSLRFLLDHRANVDAQDISGQTPLYEAVVNDFPEGAALLLERGADPDIVTAGGDTAFSVAQSGHDTALLNLLRQHVRPGKAIDITRVPRIDISQWQVMCWENKNWTLYPPSKMSLADGRDAIHVENTTQGNWLATLAYTHRPFETDFDAVLEVRGGRFVNFIAADGADRTIFCDCPRDSRWHVFNVHRQGKRLSFSVDGRSAPVHLYNVLDSAFTGYVGVQIEKGKSADLRRFEAHALVAPDRGAAGASPGP